MPKKWPEQKTVCFVRSYLKKTCLWNINSADYENKVKKDLAYKSLMKEFKIISTSEVKNKIRILRTTYTQELKKLQHGQDYVPKLW